MAHTSNQKSSRIRLAVTVGLLPQPCKVRATKFYNSFACKAKVKGVESRLIVARLLAAVPLFVRTPSGV